MTVDPTTPATAAGDGWMQTDIRLGPIDVEEMESNCWTFVYEEGQLPWTALPESCAGEADWTLSSTHTIPEVPVGDIRDGDLFGLEDATAFTTDQGLPAVTWQARVWMATNEYSEWDEWAGVVTVDPSAGFGNTETIYVLVQAGMVGGDAAPGGGLTVTREMFDEAVAAIVVGP